MSPKDFVIWTKAFCEAFLFLELDETSEKFVKKILQNAEAVREQPEVKPNPHQVFRVGGIQ